MTDTDDGPVTPQSYRAIPPIDGGRHPFWDRDEEDVLTRQLWERRCPEQPAMAWDSRGEDYVEPIHTDTLTLGFTRRRWALGIEADTTFAWDSRHRVEVRMDRAVMLSVGPFTLSLRRSYP